MTKKKNQFHYDSYTILKKVSRTIAENKLQDDWTIIQTTLLFAIGIEKTLKALLSDINPVYILESPEFKNSIQICYGNRIKDKTEIHKNVNEDVIAFQSSVLRCSVFSKTVFENKNILMKLKNARDIIVHHNFEKLDIAELEKLLKRDLYPFLTSLSDEHKLNGQLNFFNNLHSKLADISSSLQDDIAKQINLKIESRQSFYKTLSGSATYKRQRDELNSVELLKKDFAYPTECPSCNNQAVVFTAPIMEYDNYKNEMLQIGLDTKGFSCQFCKLEVSDYKELDYLKITPDIDKKEEIINEYSEDIIEE